jgi:hypothetical protein
MDPRTTTGLERDRQATDNNVFPTMHERLTALAERLEEYSRKCDELAEQLARHSAPTAKD